MKYFLINRDADVIGKHVVCGDDAQAISAVDEFLATHDGTTAREVDLAEFDSTPITPVVSVEMTQWQTAKAQGIDEALCFIAKKLGLE